MKVRRIALAAALCGLAVSASWADPALTGVGGTSVPGAAGQGGGQVAAPTVRKPSHVGSGPLGATGTLIFSTSPMGGKALDGAGSMTLSDEGDALARKGDWADAAQDYQKSLVLWADNKQALYGLARCAEATGDGPSALGYYRQAVYADTPTPFRRRIQEPYASHAMPFVLLLNKVGQDQEAVFVYNEMVRRMEYDVGDGHLMLKVLLPQFGDGPGRVPCSPQALEAMAHLAIGVDTNNIEEERKNLQEAVALAPDSAAAQYYLGKSLLGRDDVAAKAALQKAVQLGDDRTAQAAQVYLKVLD